MKAAESEKTVSHQRREEYSAALIRHLKRGDEDCLYRLYELSKIFMDEGAVPAVVKMADEALYQAKAEGRDRVCVYE